MSDLKPILDACDETNRAFKDGSVLDADRRTLERWLIALCDVKPPADEIQKWNLRRVDAIKYLLHVRVTERLARRTFVVSVAAFVVSVLAIVLTVTGWRWVGPTQTPTPAPPQTNSALGR